MTAHQPAQIRTMQTMAANASLLDRASRIGEAQVALMQASNRLAAMAGLAEETERGQLFSHDGAIETIAQHELEWLEQCFSDIDAMLGPGMTALMTLEARGGDVTTPALALWRELFVARGAIEAQLDRLSERIPSDA